MYLGQREAQALDAQQMQAIRDVALLPEPEYALPADLYDAAAVEFVVMTDGIGVKAQKPTRERIGEAKRPKTQTKTQKRHDPDVLILPRACGGERACARVSADAEVWWMRRGPICGGSGATLSVVALTDRAKTIRANLAALFGGGVRVVLDWYHLAKRVH